MVRSRLQNAGHFSASHIANLQLAAKELSEAVRSLEKIKQQKETERLLKEEKLEAARKKLAEREEKERELLERKQKQLKDKQDRDRSRDVEEESSKRPPKHTPSVPATASVAPTKGPAVSAHLPNPSIPLSSPAPPLPPSISTSAYASNPTPPPPPPAAPLCKVPATIAAAATTTAATVAPSSTSAVGSGVTDSAQKALKKKLKKDRKKEEEESAPPIPLSPPVPTSIVTDVASRDELVDHLLAMGFREADCLQAISLYGKDVDLALSWLCDRPAAATTQKASASVVSTTANASAHVRSDIGTAHGVMHLSDNLHSTESLRLQKERDHKEELRRINRAWNQKTEDEKRRVSTANNNTVHLRLQLTIASDLY